MRAGDALTIPSRPGSDQSREQNRPDEVWLAAVPTGAAEPSSRLRKRPSADFDGFSFGDEKDLKTTAVTSTVNQQVAVMLVEKTNEPIQAFSGA
jgi:hypothetical protein